MEQELINIRSTVKQYKNEIKNLDHEMTKLKKKWLRLMKDTTNGGYMGGNQTGATLASSESAMRQLKDESYNWYMGYTGGGTTSSLNNSGSIGLGNSFITVTNVSTPQATNLRQSFDMNDINDSKTLSASGTFSRLVSSRQKASQQQQVTPQQSIMSATQMAKGPETADLQLGGTW